MNPSPLGNIRCMQTRVSESKPPSRNLVWNLEGCWMKMMSSACTTTVMERWRPATKSRCRTLRSARYFTWVPQPVSKRLNDTNGMGIVLYTGGLPTGAKPGPLTERSKGLTKSICLRARHYKDGQDTRSLSAVKWSIRRGVWKSTKILSVNSTRITVWGSS